MIVIRIKREKKKAKNKKENNARGESAMVGPGGLVCIVYITTHAPMRNS